MPRLVIRENVVELNGEMYPAIQLFLRAKVRGKITVTKQEISGVLTIDEEPRVFIDNDMVIIENVHMDLGGKQRVKITGSRKNVVVQQGDKYYLTDEVDVNIDNSPVTFSILFEHRQLVLYIHGLEINIKPFKIEIVVRSREQID